MVNTLPKQRILYALAVVVALLTFSVYLSTLRNDFVAWDDDIYVYNNPWIRSSGSAFFGWAFTNLISGSWIPLAWMSYALDHAIWGGNPAGYHLTSSLLHGLNTFLVVSLMYRLCDALRTPLNPPLARGDKGGVSLRGETTSSLDERGILIAAGVAGVLFGLHPLRVESVAWIAERKDVLCAFFFLLAMTAYLAYARDRERAPDRVQTAAFSVNRGYALTLALFAMALASKPMAVTFPAVLLILDWYPLRRIHSGRSFLRVCIEKIPFLALGLAVSLATIKGQQAVGYLSYLEAVPLTDRLLVAARAIMMYFRNMVLPLDLMPLYPYPKAVSFLSTPYLPAAVFVCGISAVAVLAAKKQRMWLAAWGYYLITLLPVLGLIQAGEQSMADRYTYLPCLGHCIALGLIAARGWEWTDSLRRGRLFVKYAAAGAAIAVVLLLALLTLKQITLWKDSITLWNHVIQKEPDRLYIAYNNRGVGYRDRGMYDRAIADYSKAIELNPADARPYVNRAIAYAETNEPESAIVDFDTVISRDPKNADAYAGRGLALVQAGRLEEAIADCSMALLIRPEHADAFLNRGVAYETAGRLDKALEDYTRAIALSPYDHLAHVNRGNVLGMLGRLQEAINDYTMALTLSPDLVKVYLDRGGLYLKTARADLAAADFQQACERGSRDGCRALRSIRRGPDS